MLGKSCVVLLFTVLSTTSAWAANFTSVAGPLLSAQPSIVQVKNDDGSITHAVVLRDASVEKGATPVNLLLMPATGTVIEANVNVDTINKTIQSGTYEQLAIRLVTLNYLTDKTVDLSELTQQAADKGVAIRIGSIQIESGALRNTGGKGASFFYGLSSK